MSEERIVKTLCRMCDDRCGIDVHLSGSRITKIEGNPSHVWNRGRLCIKGSHGEEMFNSPQRLKKPLKRTEKGQRSTADAIEAVPHTLPALWRAEKIGAKTAKAGFDWREVSGALDKLSEELDELRTLVDRERERLCIVLRKPKGVFGIITPWNFPLGTPSMYYLAPGLAAGCPMV